MGIGIASGENRAVEAAEKAISHPLLEDISISGAKGVLMNITSSSDLTLDEMTEASDRIYQEVGDDAEIIWGQTFDEDLGEEMRITVIATGIGQEEPQLAENMHRFEAKPAQPVARPNYAPLPSVLWVGCRRDPSLRQPGSHCQGSAAGSRLKRTWPIGTNLTVR